MRTSRAGAALLAALADAPTPAAAGDADHGRELAAAHCSRCHAVGEADQSAMAGAPPLRDLQLRYPVETLAEALAEGIVTGHPQMPVFTFSAEEIDSLLSYLESLDPGRPPAR